jgi:hypothetical protein
MGYGDNLDRLSTLAINQDERKAAKSITTSPSDVLGPLTGSLAHERDRTIELGEKRRRCQRTPFGIPLPSAAGLRHGVRMEFDPDHSPPTMERRA